MERRSTPTCHYPHEGTLNNKKTCRTTIQKREMRNPILQTKQTPFSVRRSGDAPGTLHISTRFNTDFRRLEGWSEAPPPRK